MSAFQKVFCVGMNKTGTTSIAEFMSLHGFKVGDQAEGELLMDAYRQRDWDPILRFCQTADFFQDLPFSAPGTAEILLKKFPEAGFILTVRSSADEWYRSLTGFHQKVFGNGERIPTESDLQNATYRYPGFAWDANRALYPTPASDPYHTHTLKQIYTDHNQSVANLFQGRKNLLILNLAEKDPVQKLSDFLQITPRINEMPWLNQSENGE